MIKSLNKIKLCDICANRIYKQSVCDSCIRSKNVKINIKVDVQQHKQKQMYLNINKKLNYEDLYYSNYNEPDYKFTLTNNFTLMSYNDILKLKEGYFIYDDYI